MWETHIKMFLQYTKSLIIQGFILIKNQSILFIALNLFVVEKKDLCMNRFTRSRMFIYRYLTCGHGPY